MRQHLTIAIEQTDLRHIGCLKLKLLLAHNTYKKNKNGN